MDLDDCANEVDCSKYEVHWTYLGIDESLVDIVYEVVADMLVAHVRGHEVGYKDESTRQNGGFPVFFLQGRGGVGQKPEDVGLMKQHCNSD